MRSRSRSTIHGFIVLASVVACVATTAHAGDLDPPGAPAPTMLTLAEAEPRVAIGPADLPFTITQSGSYYLTGSASVATYGIIVNSGVTDVTIDLNGFTLSSGSVSGIQCGNPTSAIRIHNGLILGFQDAINCTSTDGLVIHDIVAQGNSGLGIYAGPGAHITDCVAADNGNAGITVRAGSYVRGNLAVGNGASVPLGAGIVLFGEQSRIEGNHVVANDVGIQSTAGGSQQAINNVFVRNSAADNTDGITLRNYDIQAGNDVGPIGTAATSTSPWANIEF